MHSDDAPVGRLLGRREALALLGASGIGLVAIPGFVRAPEGESGITLPSCVARPEQTEGPYFVDEHLNRSDIRSDPADGSVVPGTPLALAISVAQIRDRTCVPLAGAQVDVWQCDAGGQYSDVTDPAFRTIGHQYLRGYQLTDRSGLVRFTTIYPGWYPGRTVHIHFKIRTSPSTAAGHTFTSQIYFDDALTDRIHAQPPYAGRGQRAMRNRDDSIFQDGGSQLMATVSPTRAGYAARFAVGLLLD